MPRRRGHGEGTIFQLPDGRWRGQVSTDSGKRLSKSAKTRAEVQRWLTDTLRRQQEGTLVVSQRVTLAAFLTRWLEDAVKPHRAYATYDTYKRLADNHILPALGHERLAALQPVALQRFYADKLAAGLSRGTVGMLHSVIRRALRQAVIWGLLAANPTDRVEAPGGRAPEMQVYTPAQARRFLEVAANDSLYPLWLLAVTTGMRKGELLALRWRDIDLERCAVQVRSGLVRSANGHEVGPTKTGKARSVAMPQAAAATLRAHRPADASPDAYVFADRRGQPLVPSSVTYAFHRVTDTAGLPRIRFHDLRHTAATLLLTRGVHPKVVQEMLGHASIAITLDTYSHVLPSMQEDAARAMNDLLFSPELRSA